MIPPRYVPHPDIIPRRYMGHKPVELPLGLLDIPDLGVTGASGPCEEAWFEVRLAWMLGGLTKWAKYGSLQGLV